MSFEGHDPSSAHAGECSSSRGEMRFFGSVGDEAGQRVFRDGRAFQFVVDVDRPSCGVDVEL